MRVVQKELIRITDERTVMHFLAEEDCCPVETVLCGQKRTAGVSNGMPTARRIQCQWDAYRKAHTISERVSFEHNSFYLNNFDLVVLIKNFSDDFQNSASCILRTDCNIYDKKCLIIFQLP